VVEHDEAKAPSYDFISCCESSNSANQQGARGNS